MTQLPLSLQQTPAIDNVGDLVAVIAELLAFSGVQLVDVKETAALVKVGGREFMVGVAETRL